MGQPGKFMEWAVQAMERVSQGSEGTIACASKGQAERTQKMLIDLRIRYRKERQFKGWDGIEISLYKIGKEHCVRLRLRVKPEVKIKA